jgi:transcription-repair coupling factor (superfamily II helicase)
MQFPMKFNAMDKYFINNRIENIKEVAGMIQRLVLMLELELVMGRWKEETGRIDVSMNGEFDVLVATIIESGLDVHCLPIFINNANNGLSDLHQMRGRVGRSNKKAFCYFICPVFSND